MDTTSSPVEIIPITGFLYTVTAALPDNASAEHEVDPSDQRIVCCGMEHVPHHADLQPVEGNQDDRVQIAKAAGQARRATSAPGST